MLLSGACGVGWSSDGSLDITPRRDSSAPSILCSRRRSSSMTVAHDTAAAGAGAGAMLSVVGMQTPTTDTADNHCSVTPEQDPETVIDRGEVQQRERLQSLHSDTSRHSSSAAVDLNCSVVDTVSRNRCSRRQSMHEVVTTDFTPAGGLLVNAFSGESSPAEWCQPRAAWKRTKSYDMTACEQTGL